MNKKMPTRGLPTCPAPFMLEEMNTTHAILANARVAPLRVRGAADEMLHHMQELPEAP